MRREDDVNSPLFLSLPSFSVHLSLDNSVFMNFPGLFDLVRYALSVENMPESW